MSKAQEIQTAVAALKLEKSYTEKASFNQLVKFIAQTIKQARQLLTDEKPEKRRLSRYTPTKAGEKPEQSRLSRHTPTEERRLKDKVLLTGYNEVMFNPVADNLLKLKDTYDVVSGTNDLINLTQGVVTNAVMTTVGVSTALSPLALALTPIINAVYLGIIAERNFMLKDCRPIAKGGKNTEACSCSTCAESLEFIIDRDDGKVGRIGLAATVVLAVPVLLYSLGRKTYHKAQGDQSKKHQVAKNLWFHASSEGRAMNQGIDQRIILTKAGCPMAISIINALFEEYDRKTNYIQTIAAIAASDGLNKIKALIH